MGQLNSVTGCGERAFFSASRLDTVENHMVLCGDDDLLGLGFTLWHQMAYSMPVEGGLHCYHCLQHAAQPALWLAG